MKYVGPLYRLFLRHQITMGRVALIAALGGFSLLIGIATGMGTMSDWERERLAVELAGTFGLGLTVPIIALVLASSTLGELVADETLIYLWQRPSPRWAIAAGAWLASLTVAVPASSVPLAVSAAITSRSITTALSVAVSTALAAVAYSGVFVLLGLIVRRSLMIGLTYLFIWELFVARGGAGAARLSINTYPASLLSELTDVSLPLAHRSMIFAIAIPLIVPVVAVFLTGRWLDRMDVA